MWYLLVLAGLCSAVIAALGVRLYINIFRVPLYFSAPVVLAVALPVLLICLLPADYVIHHSSSTPAAAPLTVIAWKVNYLLTFLLTWLCLPMLQEYFRSGAFDHVSRLKDAARSNLRFLLLQLLAGAAAVVYLVVLVRLSILHLKSLIIAMAHIYSLFLALWLLAHGMVSISFSAWRASSLRRSTNNLYALLARTHDHYHDVRQAFTEVAKIVLHLSTRPDAIYREHIAKLVLRIPVPEIERIQRQAQDEEPRSEEVSLAFLTNLSQSLDKHTFSLEALTAERKQTISRLIYLENVLAARDDPSLRRSLVAPHVPVRFRYWYCYYVTPAACALGALLYTFAGGIVVQSQLLHSTRFSLMDILIERSSPTGMAVYCAAAYAYVLGTAIYAMTTLRVFNRYRLVPRASDPVSVCFYATYVARLAVPLAYNFVTLLVLRALAFETWYGALIHLTGPLNALNDWAPRLIVVPMLLSAFNVYRRVLDRLGWAEDSEYALDEEGVLASPTVWRIAEGKRIVERERMRPHSSDTSSGPHRVRLGLHSGQVAVPYRDASTAPPSPMWERWQRAVRGIIGQERYTDAEADLPELELLRGDDFEYDSDPQEQVVV